MKWLATLLLALTTCASAQAATVSVTDIFGFTTVEYVAAPGEANALVVEATFAMPTGRPGSVRFQDTGAVITPLAGCTAASPNDVTCTAATFDVLFVSVLTGDLDDSVTLSPSSGQELVTEILDGDGNDRLTGGPGSELFSGQPGSDVIIGGGGFDVVTYLKRSTSVTVSLDGVANDGAAGEADLIGDGIEIVSGGRGHDRLIGSSRTETLEGAGGNDTIRGLGGSDLLVGNDGGDLLVGGRGRDRAEGGNGADRFLMKDRTRDRIFGGPGRDRARIDRGRDRVSGVEELT